MGGLPRSRATTVQGSWTAAEVDTPAQRLQPDGDWTGWTPMDGRLHTTGLRPHRIPKFSSSTRCDTAKPEAASSRKLLLYFGMATSISVFRSYSVGKSKTVDREFPSQDWLPAQVLGTWTGCPQT
ncbi:MAG: hypothetical protein WC935_08165 [Thermoleophilia bacterium]